MAQSNTNDWSRWVAAAPPVPDFTAPATLPAWDKRRPEIRAQLWQLLGKLPPRPAVPAVKTLSREEKDGYILEKFEFDNGAGATVPGYLLIPKGDGKFPAILYCHQHGGMYEKGGKEELFMKVPAPEITGPALVKRGFVVIAIDAYGFGERAGHGPSGAAEKGAKEELSASKFNLWVGRTLWGMIVRDDLMALDYLVSRPEVDAQRVGATGFSMGATRTWWAMALDERLKTGVAVACLTRYQDLIRTETLGAHGIYYYVPNLLNHFDTEAVIALLAPRPVLFMTGDTDGGSPVSGIRTIEAKVKPVYSLHGKAVDFQNEIYPGVIHQYLPEMWQKTVNWLDARLKSPKK